MPNHPELGTGFKITLILGMEESCYRRTSTSLSLSYMNLGTGFVIRDSGVLTF